MFNAELNTTAKRRRGISLVSSLLFFFTIFLFFPQTSFAKTDPDSTKQKYDLNDPNNPDCPCHAAQKQADEEYKKMQEQNANANNDANKNDDATNKNTDNPNVKNDNVNSNSGTSVETHHYSKSNKSLKKMNKWMKKMKRRMGKKNNGTKKGKRRLANCFHFN